MRCPCCGQALSTKSEVALLPDSSMLVYKDQAVRLTMSEMKIAKAVERVPIRMQELIDAVYADDPDGGPENARNTISVMEVKLNKKLKPLGLRIGADMRGNAAARHGIYPCA